jgi:hypothetical protein
MVIIPLIGYSLPDTCMTGRLHSAIIASRLADGRVNRMVWLIIVCSEKVADNFVTEVVMPIASAMSGVDMRLEPGAFREVTNL